MAVEEKYILNQMALRDFSDTRIRGALFDLDLKTTVAEPGFMIIFPASSVVTTTATFTAPPKREATFLQSIIDDIDRLSLRSNPRFKPSKRAIVWAKLYIILTYAKMEQSFPRPSFVLDGENGIIIKWRNNGYTVRLNLLGSTTDKDYIYFENGDYDTEENVTIDTLHNRLKWLIQHGRQPAR